MDEVSQKTVDKIADIFIRRFGICGDIAVLAEIASQTRRKVELIGESEDYIPVLFENELCDYIARVYINSAGRKNNGKSLQHA